jgi:flagellar basal body-associated protein FliL
MRQIVQKMTVLAVAMLIALPLSAKEDKAEKKQKKLENHQVLSVLKLPKEITLTAEQQPKFDAVKAEFEGKLKELAAKQDEILKQKQDGAEVKEVQGKVREKLDGFLTEEQKSHLKTPGKSKKAKATA